MTLFYYSPQFLHHETGNHVESANRIRHIPDHLEKLGLLPRCTRPEWKPLSRARLNYAHTPRYVDEVWATAKSGGGDLDPDTVCSPASYDVALLAAGAACDAVGRVLQGEDRNAFCLVRPPGHHALRDRAMGFCIFNNVALAAASAVWEYDLERVLIIDWDIHHGNGTQAIFWQDPKVALLSVHRYPFYPGTGSEDEQGEGDGAGTIMNVPVEFGISREEYVSIFREAVAKMADRIRPQLILLSAGFDTHRLDPLGGLGLETEDFGTLTDIVLEAADKHCDAKLVGVLEGGYNPEALADSVAVHLEHLLAAG
ncbi:MAG: histone deacetylase [Planctomycetota bacterium]|nr:MAG: histone deacetylase [Planctomycetota bacterium]